MWPRHTAASSITANTEAMRQECHISIMVGLKGADQQYECITFNIILKNKIHLISSDMSFVFIVYYVHTSHKNAQCPCCLCFHPQLMKQLCLFSQLCWKIFCQFLNSVCGGVSWHTDFMKSLYLHTYTLSRCTVWKDLEPRPGSSAGFHCCIAFGRSCCEHSAATAVCLLILLQVFVFLLGLIEHTWHRVWCQKAKVDYTLFGVTMLRLNCAHEQSCTAVTFAHSKSMQSMKKKIQLEL